MIPVIAQFGPLTIHSYGLLLAIAVVVATVLASRDAKKFDIDSEMIIDFSFWVVASGIIGARIFFIFLNFSFYLQNPLEIIMIHHGGLAWQGGIITGFIVGFGFTKKKNIGFLPLADFCVPFVALGQSIGRIGCFLNGCCYGKEVAWGLYVPLRGAHLHPTQLYMVVGMFLIFLILRTYQHKPHQAGSVFLLYLLLMPGFRFIIEFFRADHFNTLFGLSVYQFVCMGLLLGASYGFSVLKSQSRKS